MKQKLFKLLKAIFKKFNIGVTGYSHFLLYEEYEKNIKYLNEIPEGKLVKLASLIEKSKSQMKQDLFVLAELDFKRDGFFVEFGATNGIDLSNSFLLENEFGWNGILAEPAKCWHEELKSNRNCNIETNCVWSDSKSVLNFNQVDSAAELSTVSTYNKTDCHSILREVGQNYSVNTISLNDLLDKYNAPKKIDYLSIDTEGSEYEILSNFDFSKYEFSIITCEHNYTPIREKIYNLLMEQGYTRKYIGLSKWDDWYVKSKLIAQ
ncbi:FkbM family methyltransferase [Flavobacterium sp. LB2P74]|uniref:FkbM family methyltransferase n=1 Tax=Flavobacterium sp. LB2P74 TaxID=3401717 RepID=UPI003AAFDF24